MFSFCEYSSPLNPCEDSHFNGCCEHNEEITAFQAGVNMNRIEEIKIEIPGGNPAPYQCSLPLIEKIKTQEGRKEHLVYLNSLQKPTPLQVLYGRNIPINLSGEKVVKYATRQLSRVLHPDKVKKEDLSVCEELMKRVNAARDAYIDPERALDPIERKEREVFSRWDFLHEYNPFAEVQSLIGENRWKKALRIMESLSREEITRGRFAFKSSCVYSRLLKREKALEILPESAADLKGDLIECYTAIDEAGEVAEERREEMILKLREIEERFDRLDNLGFTDVDYLPHTLYEALKNIYEQEGQKSVVDYEVYLRKTIRACPSSLEGKKRELIGELERQIINCGERCHDLRVIEELDWILDRVLPGEHEEGYSMWGFEWHGGRRMLERAKQNIIWFKETRETAYLDGAIKELEDAGKGWFIPWNSPTEEEKANLQEKINEIRGVKLYYSPEEENHLQEARRCFSNAKNKFGFSLMTALGWGRYSCAVDYVRMALKDGEKNGEKKQKMLRLALRMMNHCDTLFVPEGRIKGYSPLRKMTKIQIAALETFHGNRARME